MKKQFTSLLIISAIILASIGLSACAGKEANRYYNTAKGFSIVFPTTWESKEDFMGLPVIAISPIENADDKFRENVSVAVDNFESEMTSEEYFNMSMESMESYFEGFSKIDEGDIMIGEIPAKWLTYLYEVNGVKTQIRSYVLTKGLHGYAITCSAVPETFDNFKPTCEEIVVSFQAD